VVSDSTQRGLVAAKRIFEIRNELDIQIEQTHLILNRVSNSEIPAALRVEIEKMEIPILGIVPANEELVNFEFALPKIP
jgi:CO dehydrogenase nickel-insertion accessory protein CooC1